jgi:hypothetical protein
MKRPEGRHPYSCRGSIDDAKTALSEEPLTAAVVARYREQLCEARTRHDARQAAGRCALERPMKERRTGVRCRNTAPGRIRDRKVIGVNDGQVRELLGPIL